jgi:hypothetical protein
MKTKQSLRLLTGPLLVAAILLPLPLWASVSRTCAVQYKTSEGWSKEYFMSVNFVTGKELNKATKTFSYSIFSTYAAIWFGEGEVVLVEISRPMIGVGDSFDSSDFSNQFRLISSVEGKDQQDKQWRIETKKGLKFIDDLSVSERRLYGMQPGAKNQTVQKSPQRSASPGESLSGSVGAVVYKEGMGDWFIVKSKKGFAVLEWFGGYDPDVGDVIVGEFERYGMKTIRIHGKDREARVWVEDFWLSQDRAVEIYKEKTK